MAGYTWNTRIQKQIVLPAKGGSWEYRLHELSPENKIILSKDIRMNSELNKWIEFRSIGAAYEGAAIYSRSIIPKRFDAFVFIDSTTALHPIENVK
jgi:erythromycin esterase-like protein